MTRSFAALLAMLVLGTTASVAVADETVLAPTTFLADGGVAMTPALQAGERYRMEVGGTFQEVGPNITFDHDAAYCFSDNATIAICRDDPSLSQTALVAGYNDAGFSPFYDLAGAPPAYDASHRYSMSFVAAQSAPLAFRVRAPEVGREYPGQMAVAVYKIATATDPPANCRRSTAFAAQCTLFSPQAIPDVGEKVNYAPPPIGQSIRAKGPRIRAGDDVAFVGVDDPRGIVAAVEDSASAACFFFFIQSDYKDLFSGNTSSFSTCRAAMKDLLFRCAALKAKRGGPGVCGGPAPPVTARAAAASCIYVRLGRGPSKVGCRPTATGIALKVSARKGKKLRKALGKKPKLLLGNPVGAATPDSIGVTWTTN